MKYYSNDLVAYCELCGFLTDWYAVCEECGNVYCESCGIIRINKCDECLEKEEENNEC